MDFRIGVQVAYTHKVQRRTIKEWDGRRWEFCGYMMIDQAEMYVNNDKGGRHEYRIVELKTPKMIKELI